MFQVILNKTLSQEKLAIFVAIFIILSFGFDKKTNKIFLAPNNHGLEILVNQVKMNQ